MSKLIFISTLGKIIADLHKTPAHSRAAYLPDPLRSAAKIAVALANGKACCAVDKSALGVKETCAELKIKHSYSAIAEYLKH